MGIGNLSGNVLYQSYVLSDEPGKQEVLIRRCSTLKNRRDQVRFKNHKKEVCLLHTNVRIKERNSGSLGQPWQMDSIEVTGSVKEGAHHPLDQRWAH